eukprot:TRINITY_DN3216_c0_g1_i2.p1 TRINITY_DN3216_c0_g1~~TRINITY_DN3216_c0_g1_i2.p1  ORF type:complete len:382 (-),score=89.50 TRINITY_DN3216_c0_g1_i2:34-1056(-)
MGGYRYLFKGYTVTVFGLVPAQSIYVTTLESVRSFLSPSSLQLPTDTPLSSSQQLLQLLSSYRGLVSGACASVCSHFLFVPIDVISQKVMTLDMTLAKNHSSPPPPPSSTTTSTSASSVLSSSSSTTTTTTTSTRQFSTLSSSTLASRLSPSRLFSSSTTALPSSPILHVIRTTYQTSGVRGFYHGFFASICTHVPASALWWETCHFVYPFLFRHIGDPSAANRWSFRNDFLLSVSVGSVCGSVASGLTNFIDVVKTRMQVLGKEAGDVQPVKQTAQSRWWPSQSSGRVGIFSVVSSIWRHEGWSGFTRGIGARMAQQATSSALMLLTYNIVKRASQSQQ